MSGRLGENVKISLGIKENYGTILSNTPDVIQLTLPKLTLTEGTILYECSNITKLYAPLANGYCCVAVNCPKLTDIHIPNIEGSDTDIAEHVNFINNIGAEIIELPSVTKFKSRYEVAISTNCSNLQKVIFENLHTLLIGASSYWSGKGGFYNSTELRYIKFGKLSATNATVMTIGLCINLIHIEVGEGTTSMMYLTDWLPKNAFLSTNELVEYPSICSNNLEQFLYNFREYIIKRLAVQTSKKYIYLHATTKSHILGEDDSHYATNWIVPGESDTYLNTLNDELATRNWGLA